MPTTKRKAAPTGPAKANRKTKAKSTTPNATAAATKPDKSKPASTPKPPTGVSYQRTRPYLAGVLIREHGEAAGVTAAMVAELDQRYGDANPRESMFCLRNAWHAIRGYASKGK